MSWGLVETQHSSTALWAALQRSQPSHPQPASPLVFYLQARRDPLPPAGCCPLSQYQAHLSPPGLPWLPQGKVYFLF